MAKDFYNHLLYFSFHVLIIHSGKQIAQFSVEPNIYIILALESTWGCWSSLSAFSLTQAKFAFFAWKTWDSFYPLNLQKPDFFSFSKASSIIIFYFIFRPELTLPRLRLCWIRPSVPRFSRRWASFSVAWRRTWPTSWTSRQTLQIRQRPHPPPPQLPNKTAAKLANRPTTCHTKTTVSDRKFVLIPFCA